MMGENPTIYIHDYIIIIIILLDWRCYDVIHFCNRNFIWFVFFISFSLWRAAMWWWPSAITSAQMAL